MARDLNGTKNDPLSWLYSLLLHGVVLVLLFVGIGFGVHSMHAPPGTGNDMQPVQAQVVSQKMIDEQLAQIKADEAKKKAAQEAAKRKRQQQIEAARKAREQEQQRLAELKKQREAAQQQAAEEAAERKRKAAEEQARIEKLQQQQAAAAKAAADAKAAAEAARKKAAAEEAERKQAAEAAARKKAAEAKAAEERRAELQRELEAEKSRREEAAARSKAMGNYLSGLREAMHNGWIAPSMRADMSCDVLVTQVPGGTVVSAKIQQPCNASAAVKQSIISAVYRASPLPEPSDPSLFQRQIVVTFKPDNANGAQ